MLSEKHRLTESFILKGEIDSVSKINNDLIRNHLFSNYSLTNKFDDDQYWYMKDYLKIPYHQHIQWVNDYIRDHYREKYERTLVPTNKDSLRALIQQTGEQINTHNNVKEWHLEDSPDVDCIFTISSGKKKSYIVFEYDDGRNKHRRWKEPLEENKFILFSSSLNRYITANDNKDFLVNLSCHYQLV